MSALLFGKGLIEIMNEPVFKYDESSDTMYVSFVEGEFGTGIELNEHILLRVDEAERRAVGLTLFDYSIFRVH